MRALFRPVFWAGPICVSIAHFVVAAISLELTWWSSGLAALWPANAFLLAALLLADRPNAWRYGAAVMIGSVIANLVGGNAALIPSVFAASNIIECYIAAFLIRNALDAPPRLERTRDLWRFCAACVIAAAASATISATAMLTMRNLPFAQSWLSWFASDALGLLIVTPILLIAHTLVRQRVAVFGEDRTAEALLLFALVVATALIVFEQSNYPLIFAMTPIVMLATFRLRSAGAAFATIIVAVIGSWCTVTGVGPIAMIDGATPEKIYFLQFYLACTFLAALPVAAVLAERDANAREAVLNAERYEALVNSVGEVIFRTDVDGRWTFLNPAWTRITGHDIDGSIGQSFLSKVDAGDRQSLLDRLGPLYAGTVDEVRQDARYRHASGETRWIEVLSQALRDENGEMCGTTGTLADITDRKRMESLADAARIFAEATAIEALRIASTDELTGVASRRHLLTRVDEEVARFEMTGAPLSIALFDVDHFKNVNDRFGHDVGDTVLRELTAVAERTIRSADLVGRIGGEEFAIVMPGASSAQACAVAERLRLAVSRARLLGPDWPPVTISVGIATMASGLGAAALIKTADEALYVAKDRGRNRLELAA